MDIAYRQKVRDLNHRAEEQGAKGKLNANDLLAVYEFYGGHCLVPDCTNTDVQFDHVIPLEKQGLNARRNLQLLCESHNKAKSEKDWRQGKVCPDDFSPEHTEQSEKTYKKHDWDEIEFEYVTSADPVSLRDLAKKYSVAFSHISTVALRENWTKKRENFRDKLGTTILEQAAEEQIDLRMEISRTTLDFLKIWRRQANKIGNQDLIKILELGARASGLELDKRSITLKDWRDVASEQSKDPDELEEYFASLNGTDVPDVAEGKGAGWTD